MKYNKREIMKDAWQMKKELNISMSTALKLAWYYAKWDIAAETHSESKVRVHYGVYKRSALRKVRGSYDADTKTIEVTISDYLLVNARIVKLYESVPELTVFVPECADVISDLNYSIGKNWREICA